MKVIADLCVVPIGVGVSMGKYIAASEKVLEKTGIDTVTVSGYHAPHEN